MPRRYSNLDPRHGPHGLAAVLRWAVTDRLLRRRRTQPPGPPAPRVEPDLARIRSGAGPRLTWIGHASFLVTLEGKSVLVDPVFSRHAGRFVRRHGDPGLRAEDLPPIAALLVTHNHYDHLDAPTIARLPRATPVFCPVGLGSWFRVRRFARIAEMKWWDRASVGPLAIHFVPARHWSRRRLADTNRSWWGGFVIEGEGARIYHAGDTARFAGLAEIARRFPGITAAMIPVGAYAPAWFMEEYHLNPEQAGEAFLDLGARVLVPMHWGAFQLADEPLSEPAARIRRWWESSGPRDGREMWLPAVGETLGGSLLEASRRQRG